MKLNILNIIANVFLLVSLLCVIIFIVTTKNMTWSEMILIEPDHSKYAVLMGSLGIGCFSCVAGFMMKLILSVGKNS